MDRIDPDGRMNRSERLRAEQLEVMRIGKVIRDWRFDEVSLRLAPSTFYRPDFFVVLRDNTIEIEEVKGHWEDDARVKIKVAAKLYPFFTFRALRRRGSGWEIERIGGRKNA